VVKHLRKLQTSGVYFSGFTLQTKKLTVHCSSLANMKHASSNMEYQNNKIAKIVNLQ